MKKVNYKLVFNREAMRTLHKVEMSGVAGGGTTSDPQNEDQIVPAKGTVPD